MYRILLCFIFFIQEVKAKDVINKDLDSLYREDQFYIGVSYNTLGKKPEDLSQSSFSSSFYLGFIRDMPINKARTLAVGLGLGYSANSFNQNLLINKDNFGAISYTLLNDSNTYTKNKFSSHLIEFPLEFRWRTSSASEYNFWRVYTGFKVSYMFANVAKYKGDLSGTRRRAPAP